MFHILEKHQKYVNDSQLMFRDLSASEFFRLLCIIESPVNQNAKYRKRKNHTFHQKILQPTSFGMPQLSIKHFT